LLPYKLNLSFVSGFIPVEANRTEASLCASIQREMAARSKCMLIALLVAFAVVAPSAAARDEGAVKDAAEALAPSASGEAVHPMGLIDDIIGGIIHLPDLPLPRILPCPPPDFPKIPLIPIGKKQPNYE
jgi:hypothetical protein